MDIVDNEVVEKNFVDIAEDWAGFGFDKREVGSVGSQADLGHSWADFDNNEVDIGLGGS